MSIMRHSASMSKDYDQRTRTIHQTDFKFKSSVNRIGHGGLISMNGMKMDF